MVVTLARGRRSDTPGDIEDWMASRWSDIEKGDSAQRERPEAGSTPLDAIESVRDVEAPVGRGAASDFTTPEPMDMGLKFVAARSGDNISKLLGASDPAAIGKFLSLNGMNGRSSTLREGRSYVVPTRWGDATANELAAGREVLRADNSRRADFRARTPGAQDVVPQDSLLNSGRNIWTGLPVDQLSLGSAPTSDLKRPWLDDSKFVKYVGGRLAYGAGLVPGVARGALHTIEGVGEGVGFATRLLNPLDGYFSPPGGAAWGLVFKAGRDAVDYTKRGLEDPSRVGRDIVSAVQDFRAKEDLDATPLADTFGGEMKRGFDVGLNNGELGFDGASLLVGGEFIKGAAGLGNAAKAVEPAEAAILTAKPQFAAYFDEPYVGMGHHIVPRRTTLPSWLGGGEVPKFIMESPFNKIQENNMSKRDFFRNHYGVDDWYFGGNVKKEFGGGGWSGADLGWSKYGPLDRFIYGTSPATKALVGPPLVFGTTIDLLDQGRHP